MDKALRDTAFTAQITNYGSDGLPADVGGAWTASVVDSAGVAIAGSPFSVTPVGSGVYTAAIGALHILDEYTITWNVPDTTKRTTNFEIVGGFYFSIAELKATDPALTSVAVSKLQDVRDEVEERFEIRAHVAFVPRGRRYLMNGDGTGTLVVPSVPLRSVVAVTVDGVAMSAPDIAALKVYDYGMVQRAGTYWNVATYSNPQNISILFEHGMDEPPAPVKAKALRYARHLATPHAFEDDRMISFQTDTGIVQQSVARNGSTGFPDIDAVLDVYARADALVR